MNRIWCFLLLLTVLNGFGQSDSTNVLDEVVLSGNFSRRLNSGYQIQVFNDSILNQKAASLGNLLQEQANIYLKENGSGMVSSISLRGTTASQTGVYWNGISVNSALNGQTDFNTLLVGGFSELELRRGGGSVLLGNGAIGGAVHLKNQPVFSKSSKLRLGAGIGSYNSYDARLSGRMSNEHLFGELSLGWMTSDNDYPLKNSDWKNENGGYTNSFVNGSFGWKINDSNQLALFLSAIENDRQLSGTLTAESMAALENTDVKSQLEWTFLGQQFTSKLKWAYLSEEYQYFFDRTQPDNSTFGKSRRLIGKYDFSYFLSKDKSFRSGLEYENAEGKGSSIDEADRTDLSAYLLWHHEPGKRIMYNLSTRVGWSSAYSIPVIFAADASYGLQDSMTLKAAISSNYRLPTFNDLYWEPGGNPDLKPETSISVELSWLYAPSIFEFGLTGFVIKSNDMIQWRPVDANIWQPVNIAEAQNYGFEVALKVKKNWDQHRLSATVLYDFTKAIDKESDNQLIYVPEHKGQFIIGYSYKKWRVDWNNQWVGKVYTTTSNSMSLDPYLVANLSILKSFWRNKLTASFRVNNMFDAVYQSVAFRPMPNRNYLLNINLNLL